MTAAPEVFFLPAADGGQRLGIWHAPAGAAAAGAAAAAPLGALLYLHPFADEMNKSRRMAALASRALVAAGYGVLQLDLHGCGDSSGDFGDATWQSWVDDALAACRWLQQRCPAPLWLWGLRAGCLVAADAAAQLPAASASASASGCNLLFWHPAPSGKQLLQQFMRLKLAGEMLEGKTKGVMEGLKAQLASGQPIEVAGYAVSPALAQGLERAALAPSAAVRRLEWLELSSRPDATPASLTPAGARALAAWQDAGCAARGQTVAGPAFWQTSEIEEAPALIAATVAALAEQTTQTMQTTHSTLATKTPEEAA